MFSTCMIFMAAGVLASASPITRQIPASQMCAPNFEGVSLSVSNSAREWGFSSPIAVGVDVTAPRGTLVTADFRFEQIGSPDFSYIIKEITTPSNDVVVAVRSDASLGLVTIDSSDIAQQWNVLCDICQTDISQLHGVPVSENCNITSKASGFCVQIGAEEDDAMFIAPCNGEDSQNFSFWTATGY